MRFKIVGLENKNSLKYKENSLKQLTVTVHGLILGGWGGGLIIGKVFASEIILFLGGRIIGILWYYI